MIRALLLAASAIGGAVALGRKYVDKSIDKKLDGEIETAKALAIEQLDREIHDVVGHRVGAIAFSLLVKAGLVATVFIVYSGGYISETIFRGGVLALITAYIGYDFFRHWPHVPTAIKLFRNYRFDAKRALKEYVVTVAFDRAYEETMKRLSTGNTRHIVAVSNYSANDLSEQVAVAVSEVAGEVSFDRVKARVAVGAARAGVMMASYMAFIALVVWV